MPTSEGATLKTIKSNMTTHLEIVVYEPDGITPRDISSDRLVLTARRSGIVVFTKDSSLGEIDVTDPVHGLAEVAVEAADLSTLTSSGTLTCTLEAIDSMDTPSTIDFYLPVQKRP